MHLKPVTPQNFIAFVRAIYLIYSTTTTQNSVNSQNPSDFNTPQDILSDYTQQILTIEDVQATEDLTIVSPTDLSKKIVNTGVEARDHSIKDFISRLRQVSQGTIAAGGSNNDLIFDLKFPDSLLTLAPIRQKLKGFQFLRSDIIIKVNFVVPPTVSGSFRGLIIPDLPADQLANRTRNLTASSQFPNKIINIAEMPSLTFTLPWVSPYSHRNLMTTEGANGSFQLRRIFPSSGIIRYVVYAAFDTSSSNFDLSQPTPAVPLFAPLLLSSEQDRLLSQIAKFTPEQHDKFRKLVRNRDKTPSPKPLPPIKNDIPTIPKANSLSQGPQSLDEEVLEYLKQNSLIDLSIYAAHSGHSTNLPILTKYAKHIYNSFSDFFAEVGRPKLTNTTATEKRKLVPMEANINYNEPNTSHSFGMNSNNFVNTDMGTYGSSVDELSFDHLISRPNYIKSFVVDVSDTYQKVLLALPMDGFAGDVPPSTNPVTDVTLTHQAFIMNLFDSWLASINLDIYLFATQFHSVKLRFVVAPGHYSDSIVGLEIDDSNSTVVNFGQNSFHQVKFPEITNRLFLQNRFVAAMNGVASATSPTSATSLGTFFILVEIPLVATNDVVSPALFGMVEHYFEKARFAKPATLPILPQAPPVPPPPTVIYKSYSNIYSYAPDRNATSVQTGGPSASNVDPPKDDHCAYAAGAGETITSLRQFCTQFTSPLFYTADVSRRAVTYNPFTPLEVTDPDASTAADKIDYLLSPFAYTKGGRHVRVYFPDGYNPSVTFFSSKTTGTGGSSRITSDVLTLPTGFDFQSQRLIPVYKILEGLADIHAPYYSNFNMIPNIASPTTLAPYDTTSIRVVTPPSNSFAWSRSCAEDFSAGWLIGLPPFVINNGTVNYAPFTLPNQTPSAVKISE